MSNTDNIQQEYLTVAQTATYLGLAPQTVYNWSASDSCPLPKYTFGRGVRFKLSDIEAYTEQHRQPTVKEVKAGATAA